MAGSGHASAFHRYAGVDDFVAVAANRNSMEMNMRFFLNAELRESI
jgi:hypothetical protein